MNERAPKPQTSVPEVKQTQELKTAEPNLEEKQLAELRALLDQSDPIKKIKDFLGIKEAGE